MKIALLFTMSAAAALCQQAQISGLIQDPNGLNVESAAISVRSEETGGQRATQSNPAGFYSVASLKPGTYRIAVRAMGFQTIVQEGVKLEVGDNARLDFVMRIGDIHTVVTVKSGSPLINTENASVGTVIDRDIIDKMPLNGRGIQTLIELSPGVVAVPVADPSSGQFVVNGQRSDANNFTVDGVSANFGLSIPLTPIQSGQETQIGSGMITANNFFGTFSNLVPPDALQEFRIQTSSFAPEFGRTPGAQVEMVTRSGTNHYAGSLFEFVRNDRLDANDWFLNQQALPRPPLRFNNFGGTLSGPIQIPRIYDGHNRTFFFLSSDNLFTSQPQPSGSYSVPTVQARQAALPLVAFLLNAYPIPNRPALSTDQPGFAEYSGAYPFRANQVSLSIRLDHAINDRLMSFVRYNRAPSKQLSGSDTFLAINNYAVETETLTFGLTHILSPNIVNEIRVNGSKVIEKGNVFVDTAGGAQAPPDFLFFPPGYSSKNSYTSFTIDPPDGSGLGTLIELGSVYDAQARQIQGLDSLSWNLGAHQLKFGADYRWYSPQQTFPRLQETLFFDGGLYGSVYGPGANSGIVSASPRFFFDVTKTAFVIPAFSAYAQDTWKASRRLTLTYGLRWEIAPGPRVTAGQAGIATGLPGGPSNPVPAGKPVYPAARTDFAPRLGIAWQLRDSAAMKTVLRIGGGRFFDLGQTGFQGQGFGAQTFVSYHQQPLGSLTGGTIIDQDSSDTPLTQGWDVVVEPRHKDPFAWQWNATIEQSIGAQTFSAGYLGAVGRNLAAWSTYRLPTYNKATYLNNDASSSYHALQLQFNRRLSTRLHALVSYTWSHSIDTLSSDQEFYGGYGIDPRKKGSSEFDIRQSLNGSIIAALPAPQGRAAKRVFGNWTANSIFFARTALPTDLLVGGGRPNVVPGVPLYLYGSQYPGGKGINENAFSVPPEGSSGDLGRNVLRGLGAWQIDFALHRDFSLAEHLHFQFRAEFFNILNHPNFANPSDFESPGELTLKASPGFGTPTKTLANGLNPVGLLGGLNPLFQIGGPRTVQFALRLRF